MPAQDHPTFKKPRNPDVKIWRYMSLAKFVWMLQNKTLYFSRSDLMGDPFEGHYSRLTAMGEDAFVAAQMTDEVFASFPDAENVHRRNFRTILSAVPKEKLNLFVNCWHMNETESLAMWKLYAAYQDSICIQSTYRIFATLLPHDSFLGMVKYIDYQSEYIQVTDAFQYITHKRKSFEHERELRAVIWTPSVRELAWTEGDRSIFVPLDINALIQNIYLSPDADSILDEIVLGLTKTYGIEASVLKSDVNAPPNY